MRFHCGVTEPWYSWHPCSGAGVTAALASCSNAVWVRPWGVLHSCRTFVSEILFVGDVPVVFSIDVTLHILFFSHHAMWMVFPFVCLLQLIPNLSPIFSIRCALGFISPSFCEHFSNYLCRALVSVRVCHLDAYWRHFCFKHNGRVSLSMLTCFLKAGFLFFPLKAVCSIEAWLEQQFSLRVHRSLSCRYFVV